MQNESKSTKLVIEVTLEADDSGLVQTRATEDQTQEYIQRLMEKNVDRPVKILFVDMTPNREWHAS